MITAVVLAAGSSRRMGRPKLVLRFQGKNLLRHVVDNALASQAGEVIVVLKPRASRLRAALPHDPRLKVVDNPRWREGQSSSLKAALQHVSPDASGALFLMADQPLVDSDIIDALISRHKATNAAIVAPRYGGERASPVLFGRALFPELATLTGDTGGRELLERRPVVIVDFPSSWAAHDIDTWEDYKALREQG